jgi:alpha-maltose-1-phosphate synthase
LTVLLGHPTGNPNSHNAALAHFEAGHLEAFCVPWMPSPVTLRMIEAVRPFRPMAQRLARRHFGPLRAAPKIQGRAAEWRRLAIRGCGLGGERLSYEANDWLMATMAREAGRSRVTAVHAYEDCSLSQFVEAKRLGKACIYDLPIGYYPAWKSAQEALACRFSDWLPSTGLPSQRFVRPEQKQLEMELADLVLAPSSFVEGTIRAFHPTKQVARAGYGVDSDFWTPADKVASDGPLRFIYAGQLSLRKGIPVLIEAWRGAALAGAELELIGPWLLAPDKRRSLPANVVHRPPLSAQGLRERYRAADVFVFPSYFEGFPLVLTEALACGLPTVASAATIGPDILDEACGRLFEPGNIDELVHILRWFQINREKIPVMSRAARKQAEQLTWEGYRREVTTAVVAVI